MRIDGIDELEDGRKIVRYTEGEGPESGAGFEFWPGSIFPPDGNDEFSVALRGYLNAR